MFKRLKRKTLTRQVQIAFYDDSGKERGFLQIFINGKTGTMYSLIGRGVMKELALSAPDIMEECGIDRIVAVMEKKIIDKLKKFAFLLPKLKMNILREVEYADKPMYEIEIIKRV